MSALAFEWWGKDRPHAPPQQQPRVVADGEIRERIARLDTQIAAWSAEAAAEAARAQISVMQTGAGRHVSRLERERDDLAGVMRNRERSKS